MKANVHERRFGLADFELIDVWLPGSGEGRCGRVWEMMLFRRPNMSSSGSSFFCCMMRYQSLEPDS